MKALIDGDILQYEVGFAAESSWSKENSGIPPFDFVLPKLEYRINNIKALTQADEVTLFFTGDNNFRFNIAKIRPYKERSEHKPYHYSNIKAYLLSEYSCEENSILEADDLMAITQYNSKEDSTIICSRDKDLKQIPGWHYGWEINRQPEFGPEKISEFGFLRVNPVTKKISGGGMKFFCYQMLAGDPVDSIPGVPRVGPVKAYNSLVNTVSYEEAISIVIETYKSAFKDRWEEEILEQGKLLYIIRELDEEGKPKLWSLNLETEEHGQKQDSDHS